MRDRADTTHWRPHGREYSGANESCLPQEKEETVIGFKARSRFFSFSWDSCRLTLRRRRENVWPWSYRPPRNVLSTTSLKALGQAVNPTSACGYLTAPSLMPDGAYPRTHFFSVERNCGRGCPDVRLSTSGHSFSFVGKGI